LYQLKDNPAIASQLAQWQAMTGSWRNLFRYLERVAAVKPEDVRMVARKTLNRDNMTVAKIEPIVTGATQ
jgi:predicted Zn-dependent peptidase